MLAVRLSSRALNAWIWNLEDPYDEMQKRVQATCLQYGLKAEDLADRLYVNGSEDGLIVANMTASGARMIEPVVDALVQEVRERRIDVLVIDPFVSCHQISENDNSAIDTVVQAWRRVAREGNCAVELVHHSRKLGDSEVNAESARGASAAVAACRDVRVLNRMTEKQAEAWNVENHRAYFRLYSDKSNLAPASDKSDWYRLVSVDLGNGPPGESDLLQAVVRWYPPNALDGVSVSDVKRVQKIIAKGEWRASPQAENWAGNAVAEALDLDVDSPADKARIKSLLKTWREGGAIKEVEREDRHRKERKFIEVGEWITD